MGYRVEYPAVTRQHRQHTAHSRAVKWTGLCFLVFLLLVTGIWPRGKTVLQGLLFSGDAAVTVAALEGMTSDLRAGVPFADALEAFCFQVIQESEIADH